MVCKVSTLFGSRLIELSSDLKSGRKSARFRYIVVQDRCMWIIDEKHGKWIPRIIATVSYMFLHLIHRLQHALQTIGGLRIYFPAKNSSVTQLWYESSTILSSYIRSGGCGRRRSRFFRSNIQNLQNVPLVACSGGSRIYCRKGRQHHKGGFWSPTSLCFKNFECQNKTVADPGFPLGGAWTS